MLIGHGTIFADRPPPPLAVELMAGCSRNIAIAGYGPCGQYSGHDVHVREIVRHLVFFLALILCFGEKPDEEALRRIEDAVRTFLRFVSGLNFLTMVDKFYTYLFKRSCNDRGQYWMLLKETFLPLIRSHLKKKEASHLGENNLGVSYLDRLVDVRIEENITLVEDIRIKLIQTNFPVWERCRQVTMMAQWLDSESNWWKNDMIVIAILMSTISDNVLLVIQGCITALDASKTLKDEFSYSSKERVMERLTEDETLVICSEFFLASTKNTTHKLEWIVANLVKNSAIQEKLFEEVLKNLMDDDLQNIPYLKVVVFERLRCHPPSYLIFLHTVTEDVTLNGYTIPKGTVVK
ncbi:cytochrome P450 77A2-like [Wolffia australiana]